MARIESTAVGGYFKTPSHLVPVIASYIDAKDSSLSVCDPCAGEGEAIQMLVDALAKGSRATVYTAELEAKRARITQERFEKGYSGKHLNWDAMQVTYTKACNVLYLNPPYENGKLEKKFLERFTDILVDQGCLVYVVPHYSLDLVSEFLAKNFTKVTCVKFPEEDFKAFKQVVIFAVKARRITPDPTIQAQVMEWSKSVQGVAELSSQSVAEYSLPDTYYVSNPWMTREIDLLGLCAKYQPWKQTSGKAVISTPQVFPELPVAELLFREYPVVTQPRPAHIASGIASGLFNGRRVFSTSPGFNPGLVKGVFNREFEVIREIENSEGVVTQVVEAQKPTLITTFFDLVTQEYKTLRNEGRTEGLETIEDLLAHYGEGLMDVMKTQCPVKYDPERDNKSVVLAKTARKLFKAQEDVTKALVQLIRENGYGILIGEIGSGKTSCALTAARTLASNMLVIYPPHLLTSWRNEIKEVLPEAEVVVLEDTSDIDNLAKNPRDKFVVALLSREDAKLGHTLTSVEGRCPKCGRYLESKDYSKRRALCEHTYLIPKNPQAKFARDLAERLLPYFPNNFQIQELLNLPIHKKRSKLPPNKNWEGGIEDILKDILRTFPARHSENWSILLHALLADYNVDTVRDFISKMDKFYFDESFGYLLPQEEPLLERMGSGYYSRFNEKFQNLHEGKAVILDSKNLSLVNDEFVYDNLKQDSKEMALALFESLCDKAEFAKSQKCGEPLFQSSPKPRRTPLAKYITKRHPNLFKLIVADECHEYATDGSAQEKAFHRLCGLKVPTILLTGSLMNGYAKSLFTNMWYVSREFREEFERDGISQFVDRYGYRERLVSDKDDEGFYVEFGSQTDRVTRTSRIIGEAPGILPIFLFKHLLKVSVTLHKEDLDLDIPPLTQHKVLVNPTPGMARSYKDLLDKLLNQIKEDRDNAELAGKLFGALAEVPSYLDRISEGVGNQDNGNYEIRYPQSVGGSVVTVGDSLPLDVLTPKEQWLVNKVVSEIQEGRNVMVLTWHTNLTPRIARLLERELGIEVPVLKADKVATKVRQDWIQKNVVNKGCRVMLANPVTIQTGLNNLVHFSTQVWMENPAANPNTVRQTIGRIHRIGQKKESRVFFPIYDDTIQVQMYDLLMKKIAISIATDGLDPESVLMAAGASSSYLSGLSLGRQLWEMMKGTASSKQTLHG